MTGPIPGLFNDGKTALTHAVTASLDGAYLIIASDAISVRWSLRHLLADRSPGEGEVIVSTRKEYDARLTLKAIPPEFLAALSAQAPQAFNAKAVWRRRAGFVLLLTAAGAGMAAFAFFGVPRLAQPLARMTPPGIEARMGASAMAQISQIMGDPVKDAGAQAAIQKAAERIGAAARPPFPLRTELIQADFANAFALPGGHIVITCPLIAELESPAELQAVMAHEIAHVTERHVMAGVIRALGAQASLALLTGGGGSGPTLVRIANQAAQMSFSREDEAAADRLGLSYLDAENLDASGLAKFFSRMAKKDMENGGAFLATHPASKARAEAARRPSKGLEAQAFSPEQWSGLKNACAQK